MSQSIGKYVKSQGYTLRSLVVRISGKVDTSLEAKLRRWYTDGNKRLVELLVLGVKNENSTH